jgi:hypothetical protein
MTIVFGARKPDAVLLFESGNYEFALQCFESAKTWALENGLDKEPFIKTLIYPPEIPRISPYYVKEVPTELLDNPHWKIIVEFYTYAPKDVEKLKKLKIPENCWFTVIKAS